MPPSPRMEQVLYLPGEGRVHYPLGWGSGWGRGRSLHGLGDGRVTVEEGQGKINPLHTWMGGQGIGQRWSRSPIYLSGTPNSSSPVNKITHTRENIRVFSKIHNFLTNPGRILPALTYNSGNFAFNIFLKFLHHSNGG